MEDRTADFGLCRRRGRRSARETWPILPDGLKPLAAVAYNYRWSWLPGEDVFREINPHRWARRRQPGEVPLRPLAVHPRQRRGPGGEGERPPAASEMGAVLSDPRASILRSQAPWHTCAPSTASTRRSDLLGGLGVLAGDTLKEASDRRLVVAIGLLYRRGYHRQRLDTSGRQLEYWVTNDPKSLPMARISVDGAPLKLSVDVFGRRTWFQVWRVDVGRPLLLIDSEVPENDHVQRWYTARLYEGERPLRLAQYALLGIGGVRVLRALGIEPGVFHLNEGHPALAALEVAAGDVAAGASPEEALGRVRERFVFTRPTRRCLPGTRRMGARNCWPPCPTSPSASVSTRRRSSISSGRRRATRARALG